MLEGSVDGWDIMVARLELSEGGPSRIYVDVTSSDRSGRVLHLISTTVEGLMRGSFPGSDFKRLVISGEQELDLDVLGEELVKLSSKEELRGFSRSHLKARFLFFCQIRI